MLLGPFSGTNLRPEVQLMNYCACADIIVPKAAENNTFVISSRMPEWPRVYWKMVALNWNMTSDFKPEVLIWSKLRMNSEQELIGGWDTRTWRDVYRLIWLLIYHSTKHLYFRSGFRNIFLSKARVMYNGRRLTKNALCIFAGCDPFSVFLA